MMLRTLREGRMPGGALSPHVALTEGPAGEDLLAVGQWLSEGAHLSAEQWTALHAFEAKLDADARKRYRQLGKALWTLRPPAPLWSSPGEPPRVVVAKIPFENPSGRSIGALYLRANLQVVHHVSLHISREDVSAQDLASVDAGLMTPASLLWSGRRSFSEVSGTLGARKIEAQAYVTGGIQYARRQGLVDLSAHGRALELPAQGFFYLEVHLFPTASAQEAGVELELFADRGDEKFLRQLILTPKLGEFEISAGERLRSRIAVTLKRDVEVVALSLHTHYRGVSGRLLREHAGTRAPLVLVPFNQLKLQRPFNFQRPLLVRTGERLVSEIDYDNSPLNEANPDPRRRIDFGLGFLDGENHLPRIYFLEAR